MQKLLILIFMIVLSVIVLQTTAQAQLVTKAEALAVARNWIQTIIQKNNAWGTSAVAAINEINELKSGNRLVGYFCQVDPRGYIIISSHQALAPIKAYSDRCNLDPQAEQSLLVVIRESMREELQAIEKQVGPIESATMADLRNILETNYQQTWQELKKSAHFIKGKDQSFELANYQEGDTLLETSWHQYPPFNDQCPNMGCTRSDFGNYNSNAKVGCTATAGAQIMRYYCWPPFGSGSRNGVSFNDAYDWPNMLNRYVYQASSPTKFVDENGDPVTSAQINAVAELCHEVGVADTMNYGCNASEAATASMANVYETFFRYHTDAALRKLNDYTPTQWYNIIKEQLNNNRPLHYHIQGHSLVCDGWQVVGGHSQMHMNYGHDDTDTGWYTLPGLGNYQKQWMIINIRPAPVVGRNLGSNYSRNYLFPYRYFDRDAYGSMTLFESGQRIQFLPNITVTANSGAGRHVTFIGEGHSRGRSTYLYTRGDLHRGIIIQEGAVILKNGGSLKFH